MKLKPIKPKADPFKLDATIKLVKRETADVTQLVLLDYQETVKTWRNKPVFSVRQVKDGSEVSTSDPVYNWTDKGTKPHNIFPVRAKRLRFGLNSQPKTTPGNIMSGAGAPGSPTVFSRGVRHPGTEPRKFSVIIGKKRSKELARRIREGLARL